MMISVHTIISSSIPFREVIRDLAQEMNTGYSQDCEEYFLEIPERYGRGTIRGINFEEGIGLLMYDCCFKEDTEIQFIVNEVHPLKFMFCAEGSFIHRFQGADENNKVEEFQNIIVASDKNRGHIIRFRAGVRAKLNNLEIDRTRFRKFMSCEISKLKPELKLLFEDVKGSRHFYYIGSFSIRMADIFSRIDEFRGGSFERNLFIHSKSYLIFYNQIIEYWDERSPENRQFILRKRELSMVRDAAKSISSNLLSFKSVSILARQVGLNPNKLQNGFKEVYGMTVNSFVKKKRIEEAGVLIKNTDLSFAEIADKVGISSKSYFSKILKEAYGLTPSEIRKKDRVQQV